MDQLYRCTHVGVRSTRLIRIANHSLNRDEGKFDEARLTFLNIAGRRLDWPEMIFDAWTSFEHLYGTLEDLQACLDRVEREQANVNAKRLKEAERASQAAVQTSQQTEAAATLISEATADASNPKVAGEAASMDVDDDAADFSKKRKLETDNDASTAKKAKQGW